MSEAVNEFFETIESDLFDAPREEIAKALREHTLMNDPDEDIEDDALFALKRLADRYALGNCHHLALALMERTGAPAFVWDVRLESAEDWCLRHAGVMATPDAPDRELFLIGNRADEETSAFMRDARLIDAHGEGPFEERDELYGLPDADDRYRVISDPAEATRALLDADVAPDSPIAQKAKNEALDDAAHLPTLSHLAGSTFSLKAALRHVAEEGLVSDRAARERMDARPSRDGP